MYEVEIWIDVECHGTEGNETLCTLFADHRMPMRPQVGESLSFHQAKGSALEFNVIFPIGSVRSTTVSVEIEEVRHYAVNSDGSVVFKTAIRCGPIALLTKKDAQVVCKLMTEQLGFGVDPYAINKLTNDQPRSSSNVGHHDR